MGTGPGELQPLGGLSGRAGTGVRQARRLEHKISGGTNSQGQAGTESTPKSEGLLSLHAACHLVAGTTVHGLTQSTAPRRPRSLGGPDTSLNLAESMLCECPVIH